MYRSSIFLSASSRDAEPISSAERAELPCGARDAFGDPRLEDPGDNGGPRPRRPPRSRVPPRPAARAEEEIARPDAPRRGSRYGRPDELGVEAVVRRMVEVPHGELERERRQELSDGGREGEDAPEQEAPAPRACHRAWARTARRAARSASGRRRPDRTPVDSSSRPCRGAGGARGAAVSPRPARSS